MSPSLVGCNSLNTPKKSVPCLLLIQFQSTKLSKYKHILVKYKIFEINKLTNWYLFYMYYMKADWKHWIKHNRAFLHSFTSGIIFSVFWQMPRQYYGNIRHLFQLKNKSVTNNKLGFTKQFRWSLIKIRIITAAQEFEEKLLKLTFLSKHFCSNSQVAIVTQVQYPQSS